MDANDRLRTAMSDVAERRAKESKRGRRWSHRIAQWRDVNDHVMAGKLGRDPQKRTQMQVEAQVLRQGRGEIDWDKAHTTHRRISQYAW
eukprot:1187337-Prorocentrum_minimum.AAC.2